MAVYSMTGYATAQSAPAPVDTPPSPSLGLEIRSVNSRFLDLAFRLPDELKSAEPALRELVGKHLKRGKVELRGWIEGRHDGALTTPSPADLQKLVALQDRVCAWLPKAAPLSVAEVLSLTRHQATTPSDLQESVMAIAQQTLESLKKARGREGTRLAQMLKQHTAQLRKLTHQAQPLIPLLVEQQRQRFLERWNEAMGASSHAVNPEAARDRALTEATSFAIRIDVAEELTRLTSHLIEIDRLLEAGGELGKRLDFLIQELHREANTLGSKSSSLELTRISVDMKVLVEQMREQVQNIE